MTIELFLKLDEHEQYKTIWEGSCMGYREDNEYKIITYKVSDFYVELYYQIEQNVLKKISPISTLAEENICKMNPATLYE